MMYSTAEIFEIAFTSLVVSGTAVAISTVVGVPLGIALGRRRKAPNVILTTFLNTSLGLPPVVVGLFVYLLLFNRGPLGWLELIFTPIAMVIAQVILTLPIVIGITRSSVADVSPEYSELLITMGATNAQLDRYIWLEARQGIYIGIITALGRAFSEVGAIIIAGGNIRGYTRVLTTAIVTETSKGEYLFSISLGLILLSISFSLIFLMTRLQLQKGGRRV